MRDPGNEVDTLICFELNVFKKNFPLHVQTMQAKSSSQPINLFDVQPLMKPLRLVA